mmetsp:Transcript_8600/g.24501  ORF Transcript_8600/g.24501 Transcript_8600/m.24501 type:complete len:183 (+) Transcript_8600:113-661(+)
MKRENKPQHQGRGGGVWGGMQMMQKKRKKELQVQRREFLSHARRECPPHRHKRGRGGEYTPTTPRCSRMPMRFASVPGFLKYMPLTTPSPPLDAPGEHSGTPRKKEVRTLLVQCGMGAASAHEQRGRGGGGDHRSHRIHSDATAVRCGRRSPASPLRNILLPCAACRFDAAARTDLCPARSS